MQKTQEYHVYVTDGRGAFAAGRNFTATSEQDAIEQAKTFPWSFPIPTCCTQWVATRERAFLAVGRRLSSRGK